MIFFDSVTYTYPFQKKPAISNLSFNVEPGSVTLITGASGCGKSTIVNIANGLIPHYLRGKLEGNITIAEQDTRHTTVAELSHCIGSLFQNPEEQFFCGDVYSECAFAHELRQKSGKEIQELIEKYSCEFELEKILHSSVFTLSEGEKQKVALASIMSLQPRALVLDEPTANLSPEATEYLASYIKKLKEKGFAILIVDHRLYWLEDIADSVIIMKNGTIEEQGPFSILHDSNRREKYGLRDSTVHEYNSSKTATGSAAIEGHEITHSFSREKPLFSKLNFCFERGTITTLAGSNGAGKTTLARIITGLLKPDGGGIVSLYGKTYTPKQRLKKVSLVSQITDHQLYMRTVRDELKLSSHTLTSHAANSILDTFQLAEFADRHPQSLSGGQKQRLVIAAAIAKKSECIILDEPTSGLDGTNMNIITSVLREHAENGQSIVVITHDKEFSHKVSHNTLYL